VFLAVPQEQAFQLAWRELEEDLLNLAINPAKASAQF
jgi:hypothetical protein